MKRWSAEVTFEESRAHLGVETQRQWSDLAIERRRLACLDSTVLLLFLVNISIPTEMSLFNKPGGIESRKRPLVMCFLPFVSIFGEISVLRHHLKTLMSFYFHAQTSLGLCMPLVPLLKMGKVQDTTYHITACKWVATCFLQKFPMRSQIDR